MGLCTSGMVLASSDAIGIALIGETHQRMYSSRCGICDTHGVLPMLSNDLRTLGILSEPLGNCALGLGMRSELRELAHIIGDAIRRTHSLLRTFCTPMSLVYTSCLNGVSSRGLGHRRSTALHHIRKMQPSFFSPFAYIRQKKELTSIQSLSFCAFSKRMQKACPPYLLQLLQLILTCIFFYTSLNAFMYLS